ncbi:MAG: hypothetical protein CSB32_02100 [Desulfobacterales bacterium]|nr:MAG: hypothetical protein CSB32_02100 [Desulfobacterales bacterium]
MAPKMTVWIEVNTKGARFADFAIVTKRAGGLQLSPFHHRNGQVFTIEGFYFFKWDHDRTSRNESYLWNIGHRQKALMARQSCGR